MHVRGPLLSIVLVGAAASALHAGGLFVGPVIGGSFLTSSSPVDSHGSLVAEATLGRSFLAGGSIDVEFGPRVLGGIEVLVGPYHGDAYRYCLSRADGCRPSAASGLATRHAVLVGVHYTHLLRPTPPGVFVGLGLGLKSYSYDRATFSQGTTAATVQGVLGVELVAGRTPVRVEARGVWSPENPYLADGRDYGQSMRQFELQVLGSARFRLRK